MSDGQAINRFADRERLENLQAVLYNCIDGLPPDKFSNAFTLILHGERVITGLALIYSFSGEWKRPGTAVKVIVIADDPCLEWPQEVLYQVQAFASANGFYVSRMMPQLHSYHLDDAPDLRSCNLMVRARPGNTSAREVNLYVTVLA